jgi:hypothetical protein
MADALIRFDVKNFVLRSKYFNLQPYESRGQTRSTTDAVPSHFNGLDGDIL